MNNPIPRIWRYVSVFVICISFVLISSSAGERQVTMGGSAGTLDRSFSGDGKLTDGLAHAYENITAIAMQPDGKIVVAGPSSNGNWHTHFSVARYNADGSLDASFGEGGRSLAELTPHHHHAAALALQTDGKIVVAGWAYTPGTDTDFALVRYNPDGSLDNSFDGDGKVTTPLPNMNQAHSVDILPNGKIVAAGTTHVEGIGAVFAVLRYTDAGSLDSSFDGDGIATTDVLSGNYDEAFSVATQTDSKIVVAGRASTTSGQFDFAIVRYNADGSLDTGFDGDGKATTAIGPSEDDAWSVAIQPDGKIVAAGTSSTNSTGINFDFAVVRYNTNGTLDTSFDNDGKVSTPVGESQDYANAVLIQADGKIVTSGSSFDGAKFSFASVRYNPNGTLDTSFDLDGKVITSLGQNFDEAHSAAIQPDGRIVVAGATWGWFDSDFAIARYNSNGSLDSTFNGDGWVSTDFGIFDGNSLAAVALQPDGKIVTVGTAAFNVVVARYQADGSPDPTLGGTGKVVIRSWSYYAYDVALQSDGKIVFTAYDYDSGAGLIARLNPDGTLDSSFDGDGMVTADLSGAGSVAIQQDGKIVVQVSTFSVSSKIHRYNVDGSLDTTFANPSSMWGNLAIQQDGKILLAGSDVVDSTYDFVAVRYNTNGSPDTTFGTNGTVVTPIAGDDFARATAIQPDGKILVCGSTRTIPSSGDDLALVRYNSDGSLDPTFDFDGKVVSSIVGYDSCSSVGLQGDGKIVASGTVVDTSIRYDFTLLRFESNGSPDTTFGGGDGVTTLDFGSSSDYSSDMALDERGRAVIAGASDGAFAIARFLLTSNNTAFDFDDDGRSDISVFRPANGVWYLDRSTDGFTAVQFGLASDALAPADYDGDGRTDVAIFRGGVWWMIMSSVNTV